MMPWYLNDVNGMAYMDLRMYIIITYKTDLNASVMRKVKVDENRAGYHTTSSRIIY